MWLDGSMQQSYAWSVRGPGCFKRLQTNVTACLHASTRAALHMHSLQQHDILRFPGNELFAWGEDHLQPLCFFERWRRED